MTHAARFVLIVCRVMSEKQPSRFFSLLLIVAVVAVCGCVLSTCPADPDLWGHVQYGRDVLHDWSIPATTTYSYSAPGYRWINHENIAEIVLAIGIDSIGPIGMKIAKSCLGILAIGLMIYISRRKQIPVVPLAVCCILAALNMSHFWILRPQLATLIGLTLLIGLLEYSFAGWQDRWHLKSSPTNSVELNQSRLYWLWLAVPLFFIWANSHGGFVAGVCIFCAVLFFRSLEIIVVQRRSGIRQVCGLGLIGVASVLATLINPYGPGLHAWLVESLGVPRPEISEWVPVELLSWKSAPALLLFGTTLCSLLFSRKEKDFTKIAILMLVTWQTIEHMRHLALLAILFGFWIPPHFASAVTRIAGFKPIQFIQEKSTTSALCKAAISAGLLFVILFYSQRMFVRWTDLRVHRNQYPVSALQFIADNEIEGKMVVTFDWAQYVIGAFGQPQTTAGGIQVGFDGRFRTCYPQEIVDMHFDFILGMDHPEWRWRSPNSPPFDPTRVLRFGEPDLVLISREEPHSVRVMSTQTDLWQLIYQDQLAQLWARRTWLGQRNSKIASIIGDQQQTGTVTWPAFPQNGKSTLTQVSQTSMSE